MPTAQQSVGAHGYLNIPLFFFLLTTSTCNHTAIEKFSFMSSWKVS